MPLVNLVFQCGMVQGKSSKSGNPAVNLYGLHWEFSESGERLFGAGLTDDQIDLAGLRGGQPGVMRIPFFC